MTPAQMAALARWIRLEALCAAAYGRASENRYLRFQERRTKAMQEFWELMQS